MGKIDDGFERALELEDGEELRGHVPAMHRVGRSWVGGRAYVSDRRFFFCPGVMSRGRYETLRLPLSSIADVEQRGRNTDVIAGGLRRRVVIRTTAGDEHAFTMPRFARHARELQVLLADQA